MLCAGMRGWASQLRLMVAPQKDQYANLALLHPENPVVPGRPLSHLELRVHSLLS